MFTSIDKALVALLMALVYFGSQLGIIPAVFANEALIQNVAAVLGPMLVWLVPNKS